MFLFKKIVAPLFFPLSLSLEILLIGVILLWFTGKQKAGKMFVTTGVVLLLLFGYGPLPAWMLSRIETKHTPASIDPRKPVTWIVVLGGGHSSNSRLPANSQLSGSSVLRVVEGIRLWRQSPQSKILVSGGSGFDKKNTDAGLMAQTAMDLGVPEQSLVLEDRSRDTKDESEMIAPIVGKDPFLLVTSASHMPRSLGLFEARGMHPIAAPTDFHVKEAPLGPDAFYPSPTNIVKAESAMYEFLGLTWESLNGRL